MLLSSEFFLVTEYQLLEMHQDTVVECVFNPVLET